MPAELRRYETPYYVVYTDLEPPVAAEAVVRLKVLAEFYRARTRELGVAVRIRQRLPVYLFRNRADYLATGAPPESAGAFLGDRLVAAATDRAGGPAWNVIQHEAFHQFAAASKGPELPGWVSEGLAEYFGEALFTGDGFVAGVVPPWRLARVKKSLRGGAFLPLQQLLLMSQDQWNEKVAVTNYDQAWSVVQFILHGRTGRGDAALSTFIRAVADGTQDERAWEAALGDVATFEHDWRAHWLALPDDPTADRYAEAAVAAVIALLARAEAAGQSFDSPDQFFKAAEGGTLRIRPEDWLPPSLAFRAKEWAPRGGVWAVVRGGDGAPALRLSLRNGTRFVGSASNGEGRTRAVSVRRESAGGS